MAKVYRSDDDVVIAGVLSGIAEYFKVNADILRVLYVIAGIVSGQIMIIFALYVLGMFMFPKRNPNEVHTGYTDGENTYSDYAHDYYDEAGDTSFYGKARSFAFDLKSSVSNINNDKTKRIVGIAFIVLGIALVSNRLVFSYLENGSMTAVLLIMIGFFLIFKFDRRGK